MELVSPEWDYQVKELIRKVSNSALEAGHP